MPAPIVDLLDALVTAINEPEDDAALSQDVLASRGYFQAEDLKSQKQTAAWLSPQSWRVLGRCGGLTLEQHSVNLRLVRREIVGNSAAVDPDQDLAAELRELLTDWDGGSTGRVVDIQGPVPVALPALSTGQVAIDLQLDCDILTGTVAADPTPDDPPQLTRARNGVWDAIDNFADLNPGGESVFARKYKTSEDFAELQLRDPAPTELPAVALYWGGIQPTWRWNRAQEWPMSLRLALWLPGDRHTYAEQLLETVFFAIYRAAPDGSDVTYVQRATNYTPKRVGNMNVVSVPLGRTGVVHALRADCAFTLRSTDDPFGES